ncbi:von Willebrand factor type A domain protein [Roseivivax sp. THAF40]|uniref:TadE/TadG family type IV pilus assembly protein n=1 Tax=unclassified Roseivivax TaxID=2639302 RepID=UPI001268F36C|nr:MULTISPECIES: TadE/TadG family type IV pilus assembly protein [unclassified Roseivivax]QFS83854.1 von Willebrand factor type A domain protein [Roseivivax sp. THAF197b]QFT47686.1 von Willebrand factor type A domain protein [Roseivivax sp. THAF40]
MCKTNDRGATRVLSGLRIATGETSTAIGRFLRAEDGNMSIMAIFGSLAFITMGGVGIDLMHAELKRTKIQNTLDRAVLAAADLDQQLDSEAVVRDYFDKMLIPDALTSVNIGGGINYRTVTGTAEETTPSNFTKFLGIESMKVDGVSTAEEYIQNVEISLVLDISGSMGDGQKMSQLRSAANTFVETVLGEDNEGLVSISLVPYSEQVNAGPLITDTLNVDWEHGYSHCLEFPNSQFDSVALDTSRTYEQMQHFQWNFYGWNEVIDTICPQYSYERIQPFTSNEASLKNQIAKLEPRAGTSIFLGMKWGTALLDPSTRAVNNNVIAKGKGNASFAGRPFDYGRADTLKTVVLMTDGQHDKSYRISNWAYDSSNDRSVWARNNLWYYLQRHVSSRKWSNFYYQKYNAGLGDELLDDICDAAKAKDIVIWTVGFETSEHGSSVMQNCASSPAHFFDVEGVEIEEAFHSIARAINQLRLTQ